MNTELYLIGQILEYNTVVTKAEFLFMIQSVNLPSSAHTITSSAHCNPLQPAANHPVHIQCTHCSSHYISSAHCSHVQPCTAICSQPSVQTAAICSHLQPSTLQLFYPVHCRYTIQCTLQLYHSVHTAAILPSAHCSNIIWCQYNTVHPVHLWTTTG